MNSDRYSIVGYLSDGSSRPFIPEKILIQDSESNRWIIEKSSPRDRIQIQSSYSIKEYETIGFISDIIPKDDEWVCIEKDHIQLFETGEESNWRIFRSNQLIGDTYSESDPLKKVNILSASARLRGVDLTSLLKKLNREKKNSESIEDVFLRIQKSSQ